LAGNCIEGVQRFLGRVYRYVLRNARPGHPDWRKPVPTELSPEARGLQRKLHQTIKRITDDFQGRLALQHLRRRNHGAAQRHVCGRGKGEDKAAATKVPVAFLADAQRSLVLMLAPFAPYLAHELWETLGEKSSLLRAPWPKYDAALAKEDEVDLAVQIKRQSAQPHCGARRLVEEHVEEAALADGKVRAAMQANRLSKFASFPTDW